LSGAAAANVRGQTRHRDAHAPASNPSPPSKFQDRFRVRQLPAADASCVYDRQQGEIKIRSGLARIIRTRPERCLAMTND